MCVFPPVPPPPCFQCVAHFSVNTEARRFILISLFPVRQCIIHQLSLQMCMRERWKGKPSVKVNTSTAPSPSHNYQKCYGKTKVSSKKKKMAEIPGTESSNRSSLYLPRSSWKVKKGSETSSWNNYKPDAIKRQDEKRKRVQPLARSALASSIFPWKLGLGSRRALPPPHPPRHRNNAAFSTRIRDQQHPWTPSETSANNRGETQRHRKQSCISSLGQFL